MAQAAGKTPFRLADDITTGWRRFVTDHQVTVIVTTINSQRVFHSQAKVNRAGASPLLPDLTVRKSLGDAGGIDDICESQ